MELAQAECKELREALQSTSTRIDDKPVEESSDCEEIKCLFQSMTCLSIQLLSLSAEKKVYQCQLLDGMLEGKATKKMSLVEYMCVYLLQVTDSH